jgi:hypothetical protein
VAFAAYVYPSRRAAFARKAGRTSAAQNTATCGDNSSPTADLSPTSSQPALTRFACLIRDLPTTNCQSISNPNYQSDSSTERKRDCDAIFCTCTCTYTATHSDVHNQLVRGLSTHQSDHSR